MNIRLILTVFASLTSSLPAFALSQDAEDVANCVAYKLAYEAAVIEAGLEPNLTQDASNTAIWDTVVERAGIDPADAEFLTMISAEQAQIAPILFAYVTQDTSPVGPDAIDPDEFVLGYGKYCWDVELKWMPENAT